MSIPTELEDESDEQVLLKPKVEMEVDLKIAVRWRTLNDHQQQQCPDL